METKQGKLFFKDKENVKEDYLSKARFNKLNYKGHGDALKQ
jgi:hypothetical protein